MKRKATLDTARLIHKYLTFFSFSLSLSFSFTHSFAHLLFFSGKTIFLNRARYTFRNVYFYSLESKGGMRCFSFGREITVDGILFYSNLFTNIPLPHFLYRTLSLILKEEKSKTARKWWRDYEFYKKEREREKYHFLPKLIFQS
jgi:hypothetical protein